MSKSSLFGSVTGSSIDTSLDSLFQSSSTGPIQRPRVRKETQKKRSISKPEHDEAEIEDTVLAGLEEESDDEILQVLEEVKSSSGRKRKHGDENESLEDEYMNRILKDEEEDARKNKIRDNKNIKSLDRDDEEEKDAEDDESSDEDDEKGESSDGTSLTEGKKISFSAISESLPHIELNKAESTVFVGNVSASVITEKSKYKQFKALFSKHGKISSIRFRSIAFSEMLPRKAAFIKHKFHDTRDTVNAYIVFKEKTSVPGALGLNASILLDHHLRVDSISHPGKQDNKRSVFVGNLDFETAEEPLWKHFGECGEIEYVRLIRDSKTNVGKGFGYVQFKVSKK